ncbi:MAG TPA: tryptophan 2,3-dioxygenase family protein [Mycobacterium sp.]|nr:tryptophan 2,3-dioxygenase family protein [Mycobacterium sp.]
MSTRRRHGAAADVTEPNLDFQASTPYDDYVGTRTLHGLLRTITDHPAEKAFLVTTQVMELMFGLLRTEFETIQHQLRMDDLDSALDGLHRCICHVGTLNGAWESLVWLTPAQFNAFRDDLGEASGFQSYAYRHVEFLLGLKSETLIRPHHSVPDIYADLERALHAPSLYDDVLAFLARQGLLVDVGRDFGDEYVPRAEVEAAWASIYASPRASDPLFLLAERLTDLADAFGTWRYRHLVAVRRSMGAKPGSGGSSGLAWLERSMAREVFPELWSARTMV